MKANDRERVAPMRDHLLGAYEFMAISTRIHGSVAAVPGITRKLGLDEIFDHHPSSKRQRVPGMITARILHPESKLATMRSWRTTTLAQELDIDGAEENEVYAAMDWFFERQPRIEKASTYFEGKCCTLAKRGHSRDGKRDKLQVVFGLLSNQDGCPVAVQVFEGNTGDLKTVASQIRKLRDDFGLSQVTLVGDRGMITSARIRDDLQGLEGVSWITALRAPQIQKMREVGTIELELFDERDLAEVTDPAYPGERLIVCRNLLLAGERKQKREERVQATETKLEPIVARVRAGKLRDRAKIGLRVGKVNGRFKVGKLFSLAIAQNTFHYSRNLARIEEGAVLDGFYVIRTGVPRAALSAPARIQALEQGRACLLQHEDR
jgi:hypothetical protein